MKYLTPIIIVSLVATGLFLICQLIEDPFLSYICPECEDCVNCEECEVCEECEECPTCEECAECKPITKEVIKEVIVEKEVEVEKVVEVEKIVEVKTETGWYEGEPYDCCDNDLICKCRIMEYRDYSAVVKEYDITKRNITKTNCKTCDGNKRCISDPISVYDPFTKRYLEDTNGICSKKCDNTDTHCGTDICMDCTEQDYWQTIITEKSGYTGILKDYTWQEHREHYCNTWMEPVCRMGVKEFRFCNEDGCIVSETLPQEWE